MGVPPVCPLVLHVVSQSVMHSVPMFVTCPAHLNLIQLTSLGMLFEEYTHWYFYHLLLQLPTLHLNMTVMRRKMMMSLSFMTTVSRVEDMCLSMMQTWILCKLTNIYKKLNYIILFVFEVE